MALAPAADYIPMPVPPKVEPTRPPVGPLRWGRISAAAGAWVVIIVIGRSVTPASSRADTRRADPEGAAVGSLVGRDYVVHISATSSGPRYTVSTVSGQVLRENLDGQALARAFPTLDPANLQAAPGALMQADTGERSRD